MRKGANKEQRGSARRARRNASFTRTHVRGRSQGLWVRRAQGWGGNRSVLTGQTRTGLTEERGAGKQNGKNDSLNYYEVFLYKRWYKSRFVAKQTFL